MTKQDNGVAGLTILLSLITMLFTIGLLVMIFSIMGSEMKDATYTDTTLRAYNETKATVESGTGELATYSTLRNVVCTSPSVTNASGGEIIASTNYTFTGCTLKTTVASGTGKYNNTNMNLSYTYQYDADNTQTNVMNETVGSISSVTDWYDIFIVIGAMVVLIFLVVLIISSIRTSGLVDTGNGQARNVGTA